MDDDAVQNARLSIGHPREKALGKLFEMIPVLHWRNDPGTALYATSPPLGQHDNLVEFRTMIQLTPCPVL